MSEYKFIIGYECASCGKTFKKVLLRYLSEVECWCGEKAIAVDCMEIEKFNNRPHNRMVELPSYQSPITGKWVDGRAARRNDLAASNCVEYDPGMKSEQDKRHAAEDAKLEQKVDEIVEKEIYAMPTKKREKLAVELENSEINVVRT